MTALKNVTSRTALLGHICWLFCLQYFVVQLIAAAAWAHPYSVLHNTISDLGNTVCGSYRNSLVCSPLHPLMNASFIALGCLMIAGAILIYKTMRRGLPGFVAISLAGIGSMLVGCFPENTISQCHILGAGLVFVCGNVALVLFGILLPMPRAFRYVTIAAGSLALVALGLFVTHAYLGLGIGGMERLTAYPQTVWLAAYGLYCLHGKNSAYLHTSKSTLN